MPLVTLRKQQDLGAAALQHDIVITDDIDVGKHGVQLAQVMIGFDGAVTETVTVTHIDATAAYTAVLDTSALSAATSYVFRPTGKCMLAPGDTLRIACTAATATETASSKVQLIREG